MSEGVDGRVAMSVVTVKPHIIFGGEKRPSAGDIDAIHHRAHDACFIANSVKSEVRVEGAAEGLRELRQSPRQPNRVRAYAGRDMPCEVADTQHCTSLSN